MQFAYAQTYSGVIPDAEIIGFINADILSDSIKVQKAIRRNIFPLQLSEFYYKDSADFIKKNENSRFIFHRHVFRGREFTNRLDSLFSREDIDFFYKQIEGQRMNTKWLKPFINSVLVDNVKLNSNHYAKQAMYSYSLPLFSFDKQRLVIIKAFFCGLLCGGGAYYVYEKKKNNNWILIRKINEWAE
jgi:hypothetical protein